MCKKADYIEVAERLYYHMNPGTPMDVPSSVYERVEKWYHEWLHSDSELDMFEWCLVNK